MGSLKVLYPIYFERKVSRAEGRRVPLAEAVEDVHLGDLVRSLDALKIRFSREERACHPSRWWMEEGRVLVHTDMKKMELVHNVAREIRRQRGAGG